MTYYVIVGGIENDVQTMANLEGIESGGIYRCKSKYFKDIFLCLGMVWFKTEYGIYKGVKADYFNQLQFNSRFDIGEEYGLKQVGYTIFDDRDYGQMKRMNIDMCGVNVFPSINGHSVYIYMPKEV